MRQTMRFAVKEGGASRPSFRSRFVSGVFSAAAIFALGMLAVSSAQKDDYAAKSWPSDYVMEEGVLSSAENVFIPRTHGTSRSSGTPEKRYVRFRIEGSGTEFTTWAIYSVELRLVGKAHIRTYVPRRFVNADRTLAYGLWIDGRQYESLDQAHQHRIARSRDLLLPAACLLALVGIFGWVFFRAWFPGKNL